MANLPPDRLRPATLFTFVGIYTFEPWSFTSRRTRSGQANSQRWGILFICLTIRAIHIEVVEELSFSAFINALRRFMAARGNVKELRSNQGTSIVGAVNATKFEFINVEKDSIKDFICNSGTI